MTLKMSAIFHHLNANLPPAWIALKLAENWFPIFIKDFISLHEGKIRSGNSKKKFKVNSKQLFSNLKWQKYSKLK